MLAIKKLFAFSQWSLSARVSALVAIPLVCISLLTAYNINTTLNRETDNLQDRAEKLLFLAANAAQLALFAGDRDALNTLADAIMRDSQIAEVLFFDDTLQQLSGQGASVSGVINSHAFVDGQHTIAGDYWVFIQSVKPSGAFIDDDPEQYSAAISNQLLGWVALTVDLSESRDYRQAVLKNNVLIALLMLSIALWLAFRFSRSVVRPINEITAAVARYGQEDFSHRVAEQSVGELGELEKGVNKLAQRVGQSQLILRAEVARATKDLENQNLDLVEAKIVADEANHAKDDFLARMSHELRTPLTGIMGFVRLLANTEQPTLRQEYSHIILTSSKVLLSTINDILDFSKLRARSFVLSPTAFNLEECLRSALDLHRVAAFEKAIELNLLMDADVPLAIVADVDKLQKVLNNILSNAVKFTDSGDIIMFVSLSQQQDDDALISVAIKDSGIGIAASDLQRLFNPFFQCDESSTRSHDGTGLGLSIAEDFVSLMGGDMSIDSEEGEGTEVEFSFRCRVQAPALEPYAANEQWRAVLFDHNPWTRRSWRNQLLSYSSDVRVATSPAQLIDNLQAKPATDVLLLGLNQQCDSKEQLCTLLQRIRASFNGAIIVAAADDGNHELLALNEHYGPLQLVSKPLTASRLWTALDKANSLSAAAFMRSGGPITTVRDKVLSSPRLLPGVKLLLAEDNKFNQQLLATLLRAVGAEVSVVSDGQEALLCCEMQRFDVLLLDLHMPKRNGLQVSEAVRKGQMNSASPIIILTADLQAEQQPAMAAAGVNAVSYKPIDEQDLIAKIHHLAAKDNSQSAPVERALVRLSARELEQELNRLLQRIAKAISAQDISAIQQQMHQLLGVIGLSGITVLQEAAGALSEAALASDLTAVARHFEKLSADCSAALT